MQKTLPGVCAVGYGRFTTLVQDQVLKTCKGLGLNTIRGSYVSALLRCAVAVCAMAVISISAQAATAFSAQDYDLYPGDFNGDGRSDLLYIGKTPDKPNGIALSDTGGAPQLGFQVWPATYLGLPWSTGQFQPVIGDFNGDGRSDVLMQAKSAGTSYVLLANGNASVAPIGQLIGIHQGIAQTAFGLEWSADKHNLLVGDFDGNGKDDLLLQAMQRGGTTAIVLSDGSGGLFTHSTSNCWPGGPQQCWSDGEQGMQWSAPKVVLAVGQFNADALADVLVQAKPDIVLIDYDIPIPVPVFGPQSNGIFLAQVPDSAGRIIRTPNQLWSQNDLNTKWSPLNTNLLVADFNGDGYADVLLQSKNGGTSNQLAYGNANGTIGNANALSSNAASWSANGYQLSVGRFGNSAQAVLYLQAQTPDGSNYYSGDITQGSVSATVSNPQMVASVPAAPPNTVGATVGSADVTANGAAQYTLPITLPTGTAGLTPELTLSYSSTAGNGMLGMGWNLTGLGTITRCPQTLAQDGITQGVQLLTTDQYCLNGNRLRLVSDSQGAAESVYRTELETYARITAKGSGTQGPLWFQVETKDGLIYEYGNTISSRIGVPGNTSITRLWALSKVRDRAQNSWEVTYINDAAGTGAYRPDLIEYTKHPNASTAPYRVKFYYENRNPGEYLVSYYQGGAINQTQRLQRIELQAANGALIRKMTLAYETPPSTFNVVSRLASVQECTPALCMAATTFEWTDQQMSGSTPAYVANSHLGAFNMGPPGNLYPSYPVHNVADIDGDGVLDAYFMGLISGPSDYQARSSFYAMLGVTKGQPSSTAVQFDLTETPDGQTGGVQPTAYDHDADGRPDLFTIRGADTWWVHADSNGALNYDLLGPSSTVRALPGQMVLDVDGDGFGDAVNVVPGSSTVAGSNGRVDVVFHRRDAVQGFEPTSTTAWAPAAGMQVASYGFSINDGGYAARTLYLGADINGDGRQDLLVQMTSGWQVLYSTGTGFSTGDFLPTYLIGQRNYSSPIPIDVNGDGCTDIVYWGSDGSGKLATSRCRTGGGGGLNAAVASPGLTLNRGAMASVADVNMDGLMDVVGFGWFSLSTGVNLSPALEIAGGKTLADVDGDTLPDRFVACQPGDNNPEIPCPWSIIGMRADTAAGPRPNLLKRATDGFGKQAEFSYAATSDPSVYSRGAPIAGKTQEFSAPQIVVKQLTASDGIGGTYSLQYSYSGARRNIAGRGNLGFAAREAVDSRTGFVTRETYNNTVNNDHTQWEYVGTLTSRTIYQYKSGNSYGPKVEELIQQWSAIAPDNAANRRYPYVSASVKKSYELTGTNLPVTTSATKISIDNYGTPYDVTTLTEEGITGLNPASSATVRVYTPTSQILNDTTNWCIARPQQVEQTRRHTLSGGASTTRVSQQSWNGSFCRPTQTIEGVGTGQTLTSQIEYDAFGNVNKTTVTGAGITQQVTEAYFGTNGHLLQWQKDAEGNQANYAWNVNLGLPTQITAPNGLTTTISYDEFGRELRKTLPDGTSTLKSYFNCTADNAYCGDNLLRYVVRTSQRNSSDGEINHHDEFFDLMGRVRFEQTRGMQEAGMSEAPLIAVQRLYDNRGNLVLQTNPYYADAGPISGVSNTYDALNRLIYSQRPASDTDSTVLTETITYSGLAITTQDAKGATQTKISDVSGNIIRATDAAGKPTQYTYTAFGELLTVTDPLGNVTTLGYDARGFKNSLQDPNLGYWTYGNDAQGQVLTQTDAKGQTTTFSYDRIGRPLTREDAPGGSANRTSWSWNNAPGTHRGQLAAVSAPGGYSETYAYDAKGRKSQLTTVANGVSYLMNYGYDGLTGQLATVTYPDSTGARLTILRSYQNGYLQSVQDASTNGLLWEARRQDERGHVTQEQFGNGILSSAVFDKTNGRLITVQTGISNSSASVQNLRYQWDEVGNLTSRQENNQQITERFTYDALYRLTSTQRNADQPVTVTYNDIGNITAKSDVGSYDYSATQAGCTSYAHAQPNAVRKVGTSPYCYDANGNMVSRAGASVVWSSYNYPTTINQSGGNSSTFYYGAERNQYRQIVVDSGRTEDRITVGQAEGTFEKLVTGSTTEYRHFIPADGRIVAIVKRSAASEDRFYLHEDHLGSTEVVTDQLGAVASRQSYDAWGKRRGSAWTGELTPTEKQAIANTTHQGFTGHEQLDNLNLVHMRGRVYDPVIARFPSADPIIQDPYHSQAFNRYSYVWNNPLNSTDPTGFCQVTGSRINYDICEYLPFGGPAPNNITKGQEAAQSGSSVGVTAQNTAIAQSGGNNSAQQEMPGAPDGAVTAVACAGEVDCYEASNYKPDKADKETVTQSLSVDVSSRVLMPLYESKGDDENGVELTENQDGSVTIQEMPTVSTPKEGTIESTIQYHKSASALGHSHPVDTSNAVPWVGDDAAVNKGMPNNIVHDRNVLVVEKVSGQFRVRILQDNNLTSDERAGIQRMLDVYQRRIQGE